MRIPSYSKWTRSVFLASRHAQTVISKVQANTNDGKTRMFGVDFPTIIVDAGDEILCDDCNDLVETDYIHLVRFGRRVACDKCFEKWHKSEPLTLGRSKNEKPRRRTANS